VSIKPSQPSKPPTQASSLSSLKARVASHPQEGESWLALALMLAHSSPGPELRQAISRSIELLPDNYQAWLLAGLELQQRQGAAGALQWLQHIVQQKPALAAPHLALAQLQANAADPFAESSYTSIIARFPQDARACLLYAEYLQNQGQLGAAGDYLERALGIQPDIVENWTALAKIRLAEQRFDAVVSAATRALELDTDAQEARLTRAEAWRTAAQWQQAKSDYQQLLLSMPGNPYVLMGLGACLAGEGEFAEALSVLTRAVQMKPDFLEASFNIALVHACQGNSSQALPRLEQLLGSGAMSPAMQDAARICRATLLEQQRLQKHFLALQQPNDLSKLQTALNQAPALLLQSDPHMAERLHKLAEACQQVQWPEFVVDDSTGQHESLVRQRTAFIEACLLSRIASDAADIAALWSQFSKDPAGKAVLPADQQPLLETWQAIHDRKTLGAGLQADGNGEAWLRYWHHRLFKSSTTVFPGLFKFAHNSIGLHQTTAPQCLVRTVRLLVDEIHPSLPAGPGRACFMLVAIAWIHAFVDGNGRLARFVFAGEMEAAGLEPILLLTQERKAMTDCQDQAQYRNDFRPFSSFLQQAQASTRELQQAVAVALQQR
jgi:tetratricopeptide (TPR) repeat protein